MRWRRRSTWTVRARSLPPQGAGPPRALGCALVLAVTAGSLWSGRAAGQAGEAGASTAPGADIPGEVRWVDGPTGRLRVVDAGPGLAADVRGEPAAGAEAGGGDARRGTPAPVLFVHSLAGSLESWAAQIRYLAHRRRAVALDLRGHGESEVPERVAYTVPDLAEDVAAVVEALGIRRVVLVGHSLGGAVIAAYAARHPGRVAGLLFVDPVGDQRQARDELVQFLFELDRDYRPTVEGYWEEILEGARPETRRRVLADLARTSPEAVVRSLEGLLYFEPAPLLVDYEGPMRAVVTPRNDLPLSLHNVVPRLRAVTVERTSHWLQMDRPAAFHRHLDAFLREVEGEEG